MENQFIKDYIDQNKDRFINELVELLKIPSISADSQYHKHILEAADFVKEKLDQAGITQVEICPTKGNPIVYGERIVDDALPTVLIYGHYDVQPADPLELWDSPPFEPIIKNEKIYARGAADDKGQFYIHIKAIEVILQK